MRVRVSVRVGAGSGPAWVCVGPRRYPHQCRIWACLGSSVCAGVELLCMVCGFVPVSASVHVGLGPSRFED